MIANCYTSSCVRHGSDKTGGTYFRESIFKAGSMHSSLIREIFRGLELTDAETELIGPYFKRLVVTKGQIILKIITWLPIWELQRKV